MTEEKKPGAAPPPPVRSEPKGTPPKSHRTLVWTIRIVVFVVLAALLGLAGWQFAVKRQFENSQQAIIDRYDKGFMKLADAKKLLEGSPEESEGKASGYNRVAIYTWHGPFVDYRLMIEYGSSKQIVQRISGKDEDIP